jgi:hypothetical protein
MNIKDIINKRIEEIELQIPERRKLVTELEVELESCHYAIGAIDEKLRSIIDVWDNGNVKCKIVSGETGPKIGYEAYNVREYGRSPAMDALSENYSLNRISNAKKVKIPRAASTTDEIHYLRQCITHMVSLYPIGSPVSYHGFKYTLENDYELSTIQTQLVSALTFLVNNKVLNKFEGGWGLCEEYKS